MQCETRPSLNPLHDCSVGCCGPRRGYQLIGEGVMVYLSPQIYRSLIGLLREDAHRRRVATSRLARSSSDYELLGWP